jgi:hypothetical protein
MKGLSIEEKAKRYDEAIKRAKELLEIGVKDTRDKRVVLSFFPELKEVSLADKPYVVYDASRIEFEQEQEPTSDHWQDLRERAAIAAMRGVISAPLIEGVNPNPSGAEITDLAVKIADALVEKLKGE